jgi:formylglycine-generating enzyme required for sulfatase activity
MTQAQWLRLAGSNPSFGKPPEHYGETAITLLNPVELVSWEDCQVLRSVGLALPTEAQWEYAARGGTDELWWCGNDARELARAANLGDRSHAAHGAEPRAPKVEEWDDGFPMTARVGSFPPNPFGLHDVIGNVREWCQDLYGSYDLPVAAEDGLRQVTDSRNRVIRGGSFRDEAIYARMAARRGAGTEERASAVGLRPARRLDTEEVAEESWESVQRRMARNPRYRGVKVDARSDLLPLGADPASGLEEFLHRNSHEGPLPARDAEGRLLTTEQTGLVFVLVPGGSFTMGSQGSDPKAANYDPAAPEDAPAHELSLAPFFISKYEMTQAQWLRLGGTNPSEFGPDANYNLHQHTLRHPVESISWEDCTALARFGMALPTEAQWEYAARGGDAAVFGSYGDDPVLLAPVANLADAQYHRMYRRREAEPWDDGYIMHAPVGLFLPNAYGLHDVLGNVAEWCRDGLVRYEVTPAPRTGERGVPDAPLRPHRGGSYQSRASEARVALRAGAIPATRSPAIGLRPVIE